VPDSQLGARTIVPDMVACAVPTRALQAALDELSGERQALTRSLLGAADSRRP